ncbi:MAG: hypothetical protein QXI38_04145 [Conexivisphaerales archaeon]
MLGLEKVRNIIGSILMQAIKKSLAELTSQKEKISAKLQGAIEQITTEVGKAENEAKELRQTKLQSQKYQRNWGLQNNFNEISAKSQSEPFSLPNDLSSDAIEKLIPKVRTFLRKCKKKEKVRWRGRITKRTRGRDPTEIGFREAP